MHSLSDLELAALLCLVSRENCLISTPPEALDDLVAELQLVRFGMPSDSGICFPQLPLPRIMGRQNTQTVKEARRAGNNLPCKKYRYPRAPSASSRSSSSAARTPRSRTSLLVSSCRASPPRPRLHAPASRQAPVRARRTPVATRTSSPTRAAHPRSSTLRAPPPPADCWPHRPSSSRCSRRPYLRATTGTSTTAAPTAAITAAAAVGCIRSPARAP